MKFVETLIDKATENCGSQAEVARRMGVARPRITEWKNGARPLSPEDAALLADLAHYDAREAVVHAVLERNAGTEKGDRLREVLGKVLAVIAAVTLGFFYSSDATAVTAHDNRNVVANIQFAHRIFEIAMRCAARTAPLP